MIVYVESNFSLELAFEHEEVAHAAELLRLAEGRKVELVFPQFAVCEPFSTLNRYDNERRRFLHELERQLSELNRSAPQQPVVAGVQPLVATLTRIGRDQNDRLQDVVERMLACGRSIDLTALLFAVARKLEAQYDVSPQDAIVAASVLDDRQTKSHATDSHCFLSKNWKDFSPMKADFAAHGCRYVPKFDAALNFIRSKA
jgi:hypothetical protein